MLYKCHETVVDSYTRRTIVDKHAHYTAMQSQRRYYFSTLHDNIINISIHRAEDEHAADTPIHFCIETLNTLCPLSTHVKRALMVRR